VLVDVQRLTPSTDWVARSLDASIARMKEISFRSFPITKKHHSSSSISVPHLQKVYISSIWVNATKFSRKGFFIP
jgi:hypothetical protein